ncbi:MAG: alkaline phosphatase D family protein [Opitutales bacterium]
MQLTARRTALCLFTIAHFLGLGCPILASAAELTGGPMVGVPEMREGRVWVQTDGPATVQAVFNTADNAGASQASAPVRIDATTGFSAVLVLGPLDPDTTYRGRIRIDGEAQGSAFTLTTPPKFRGLRPPPDFTIAAGGAHYVNQKAYDPAFRSLGGDYDKVFASITAQQPDWMLWLGGSTHVREADWGSFSGIAARYRHNRALTEAQELYRSIGHSGVVGAVDFGPPGNDVYFWQRAEAARAFRLFWPNPSQGVAGLDNHATLLRWSDAEFFLLDDRTHRDLTPDLESQRTVLGEAQLDWLIASLRRSTARFKIICMGSPILNPAESPQHLAAAPSERERLLDALTTHQIAGVVFLTGGKRYGEFTKVVRRSAPDLYELTLGPLTASVLDIERDLNFFRVPGTTLEQRHFATLTFQGEEDARELVVSVFDVDGEVIWSRTLPYAEMTF